MKVGDVPPTYVTLDLETTGIDPEQDTIIEVGAVKFQGQKVLDTFQTLVNPYRRLPDPIQRLTGISQSNLDGAPPFAAVAGELLEFIGSLPLIGHNFSFDLAFLSKHGVRLSNEIFDTREMASVLLPYFSSYSLPRLAEDLKTGHSRPHRALPDAQATQKVFLSLMDTASGLDPATAAYIIQLASRARWPFGRLLERLPPADTLSTTHMGPTGLDLYDLESRLRPAGRAVRPGKSIERLDEGELASYLSPGGLFSRSFEGFEHRPQQVEMTRAVAAAINGEAHLIVEGGTGVGKSLAYLLPAVLYSLKNGTRVVISTNTINLQEQLLNKDIPALVGLLEDEGIIPTGQFRVAPLKGRANYLCLHRWRRLAGGETLSADDARLLSKTLIWLQDTATGDRGEINLSGKEPLVWSHISAAEKWHCPGMRGEGPCFLRAARERAEGAHIIIANHALLLSDLALGGGLIPEYQHLIVDEAQHLEEEATRQLGFQVSQAQLDDELGTLGRLLAEARVLLRRAAGAADLIRRGEELISNLEAKWSPRMRDQWGRLWSGVERFLHQQHEGAADQLHITRSTRAQPGWSELEIAWENVDVDLNEGIRLAERLGHLVDSAPGDSAANGEGLTLDLAAWREGMEEQRERLKTMLAAPAEEQRIDWMARVSTGRDDPSGGSNLVLHSAPLDVGPELQRRLYSRKSSVILTSATLSTQGDFSFIRQRTGLEESGELLVDSPFDYKRAALILVPEDLPAPDSPGYQPAIERVLVGLGRALKGRTLVLFTSHSALRGTSNAIRGPLQAEGIRVLAQGIDGSPAQILRDFSDDPSGVILGTSSFWEGVDLSGGILKALVLARLPFHVPTDPIFAARSDQYEDPFYQYALPQAILRFRQGIGRLIRSGRDRGTIVVLDTRIASRRYGKAFLDSMPPGTMKHVPLAAIPRHATDWIEMST